MADVNGDPKPAGWIVQGPQPCGVCAVLKEELATVRAERDKLLDRLMAALSPPAYQAFQGAAAPQAGVAPPQTVVDANGEIWVEVGGKLVSQAEWQKLAAGAVYIDEAGRAVPQEEVDRAMDKLNEMLGGGRT